ncbi:hypothetical protein [Caballeronia sp. dw_276]|uniref:hypothetical protein n=1 Tax=Caballeronia sp. dw_276 TaxID=2719795 RepID=UPI001BD5BB67|nr:hypothetical protein [Caballeronia sp. dw_276]
MFFSLFSRLFESAALWSFAQASAARPLMFPGIVSSRFVLMAASLLALSSLAHAESGMAATSIDSGIYSGAPFAYQADRGIMSAVPDQTPDNRIFSPVSDMGDMHSRQPNPDRPRLRHDL